MTKEIYDIIRTKFGTATINDNGYYRISSIKEGNNNKYLHRLVWEDWYDKKIPKGYNIHHLNGDKLDNRIQNLQCVERSAHIRFHSKNISDEHRRKNIEAHNTTGFLHVCKHKCSTCKQGFRWCYQYSVDGKQKPITSVDIFKLRDKVIARGLKWEVIDEEKAKQTLQRNGGK